MPTVAAEAVAEVPGLQAEVEIDDEEEDEEEEDENEEPEYYFDPADVQGAVDEAISSFIKEGLVDEFKNPKEAPALEDIFAVLFGKDSELRSQAEYFEELISGYEDRAHVDDLKEAHSVLETIVDKIAPRDA